MKAAVFISTSSRDRTGKISACLYSLCDMSPHCPAPGALLSTTVFEYR